MTVTTVVDVTPETADWGFSGLLVFDLAAGATRRISTGPNEALVLPLSGSASVTCAGETVELTGRPNVFAGPSDFAYLPIGVDADVTSVAGGRFAVPTARATRSLPFRYGAVDGVAVELRGAGSCSRQVNNFCTPETFEADALIACEVLTPGGNWSSYPPHKHDETRTSPTGVAIEAELEEIYYFEVAGADGVAYQRVYGTDERPIDVLTEVRSGDVVLIPHGWHGPSMAAPGYDLYYLNVMAGPGQERAWLICDDPRHSWVRETWADQAVDPRLPFKPGTERRSA